MKCALLHGVEACGKVVQGSGSLSKKSDDKVVSRIMQPSRQPEPHVLSKHRRLDTMKTDCVSMVFRTDTDIQESAMTHLHRETMANVNSSHRVTNATELGQW